MMTLGELYALGKKTLGDPLECPILTSFYLGADRQHILLYPNSIPPNQAAFLAALQQRQKGIPLQYILGEWDFDGIPLKICPGVLIPREDTLTLVNIASAFIGETPMVGLDLCAGTGAVALALAKRCSKVTIDALERYPVPFACLNENTAHFGCGRVFARNFDVLLWNNPYKNVDFIVSNPPYIAAAEIPTLQAEVQLEPHTALNGGEDGLVFYRAFAQKWVCSLKTGGLLAVEVGETQGDAVQALLRKAGLQNICIQQDFNGLDRVVLGYAP